MFKLMFWLYVVCLACYIFYTRTPDFFDAEIIKTTIQQQGKATYTVMQKTYTLPVALSYQQGSTVEIIYNTTKPQIASVYSLFGYWLLWKELLLAAVLLLGLYKLSIAITQNPDEQIKQQNDNYVEVKKTKYV